MTAYLIKDKRAKQLTDQYELVVPALRIRVLIKARDLNTAADLAARYELHAAVDWTVYGNGLKGETQ